MQIVLDCERMRFPYTGLFEYCHKVGLNLLKTKTDKDDIRFYMAPEDHHHFNEGVNFINQSSIHKFIFPRIDRKIDIWHTTHQTSWYMPPRNREIKRVLTVHDLNFLYEGKSPSKRSAYFKRHQRNIELADHIVAISEFTKDDVIKHFKIDKPVTVIYNGCDIGEHLTDNAPKYVPPKPFIFALGTVNAKKNFHVLPCLLEKNAFDLIIAGKEDSGYTNIILKEAKRYGVENRVKIIGPISENDKYWYYKNCRAFLFPSLAEGFGIPVIEAMNFGKPVFISNNTSLPEIGGSLAYYFENFETDHMQHVFQKGLDHYLTTDPSEKIINHAKQFNWQNSAAAYWEVYKSLAR